ncbi:14254_t:CDS:2, partial [Gigaspora margarita]
EKYNKRSNNESLELYFQIGELLAEKGWCDTTSKLSVHFSDSKGKLVVLECIAGKDFESLLVEAKRLKDKE